MRVSKKGVLVAFVAALLTAAGFARLLAASHAVEILYLPHPPAEAVVNEVERIVKNHPQLRFEKHSFEDPKGRKLTERYKLREHMPVAIFINGRDEFSLGNRRVVLKNFPKGNAFVPMFEGNWSYRDLEDILRSVTRGQ